MKIIEDISAHFLLPVLKEMIDLSEILGVGKGLMSLGLRSGLTSGLLISLMLCPCIFFAGAQPEEAWSRTYGGPGFEWGSSFQETPDGGFIIAGWTQPSGGDKSDILLIKTDSKGLELWNATFGGTGYDSASSVQRTKDDGYILAGTRTPGGSDSTDLWLIKTDISGIESWNRTFGGRSDDQGVAVLEAEDGYIIAGSTMSQGYGSWDFWLIRAGPAGEAEWEKTYGGLGRDYLSSILKTEDGGYLLSGTTESYGNGSNNLWLVKVDPRGNELWNKTFDNSMGLGGSVTATEDGGSALAEDIVPGPGMYLERAVRLIKLDAEGNELWNKTFSRSESSYFSPLIQRTRDGGYVMAGTLTSYRDGPEKVGDSTVWGADGNDILVIRADSVGNELWNLTLGKPKLDDQGAKVLETLDGKYAVLSSTESYGSGLKDIWLVKLEEKR